LSWLRPQGQMIRNLPFLKFRTSCAESWKFTFPLWVKNSSHQQHVNTSWLPLTDGQLFAFFLLENIILSCSKKKAKMKDFPNACIFLTQNTESLDASKNPVQNVPSAHKTQNLHCNMNKRLSKFHRWTGL
jgi:hypothetical protein